MPHGILSEGDSSGSGAAASQEGQLATSRYQRCLYMVEAGRISVSSRRAGTRRLLARPVKCRWRDNRRRRRFMLVLSALARQVSRCQ